MTKPQKPALHGSSGKTDWAMGGNDPSPEQMLLEGAVDAVEAFRLLRIGMAHEPKAVELIDAHIDELQYAINAARLTSQGNDNG